MYFSKFTFCIAIIGLLFVQCTTSKKNKDNSQSEPIAKPTIDKPMNKKSEGQQFLSHNVPWSEISALGKSPYDFLVPYGEADLQFGELRTPETLDTFPLVILIHGGCWLSDYNLDHTSAIAADLVKAGYAVWTPEYRRVGNEGGGYPGTFQDIQASVNFVRELAAIYPLDLNKIVIMGHSAGGHLALWLATQHRLPKNSILYNKNPLPVKGIISLAGITDLVAYDKIGNDCSTSVTKLMGGDFANIKDRYTECNPINLLPTTIPIRLVHGDLDNIVPLKQSIDFAKKLEGADVKVQTIQGGGHFDMVSPHSAAWQVIKAELKTIMD